MRYLRKKTDGYIYVWTPHLAQREDMEPYEPPQQGEHHILVPSGSLKIVARGALTVEEPKVTTLVSETEAQQLARNLFRRKTRKAA